MPVGEHSRDFVVEIPLQLAAVNPVRFLVQNPNWHQVARNSSWSAAQLESQAKKTHHAAGLSHYSAAVVLQDPVNSLIATGGSFDFQLPALV